jgi:hypothetical protein
MTKPQRITLSRAKGWKMPPNTVKVDRSTKFGNPFSCDEDLREYRQAAVEAFRSLLTGRPSLRRHNMLRILKRNKGRGEAYVARMRESLPELRGKNLACWCKPGDPCHADVLLELANAEVHEARSAPPSDGGREQ